MTTQPLLSSLPLFPLGTVLFPGGLLPLRIFEVRYLDMIGKCHKAGSPFGVVSLTQGSEVRRAGAEAESFATLGTLAVIREFEMPQSGLMQIECVGTQRFRVRSSELQKYGLWTAEVESVPDDIALEVPTDLQHAANALRRLVDTLEERRRIEGDESVRLPIAQPYRFEDCGWVANRWCELLPMQAELKQRLMELDSPLMRLELVSDLLARTGIAE
ncbi:LON peptidase substrate-binding domain-containing protein [Variovorax sp. J22P240]|uniref:LON peptidase substrate-binding domain-containing protein n=1 Tax=unclassified Variovorax TaxID=663243 RepID=UPI002576BBA3|nr:MULTISPECIES: LON peptidase substrate-binding domain-containing protein [unclassified Variovorax]MDL9998425.1 LON peptidase substrate-binding domain-containing protein [Variovorax sp. J22P240]MDM0052145.1 LON peptidase substrate-binding domain-containing protein [Variovorax sp. J22R115]